MQDTVDPAAAPLRTLAQSFENARREVKAFMPSPLPFSRSARSCPTARSGHQQRPPDARHSKHDENG